MTIVATDSSTPKRETAKANVSITITALLAVTTKNLPAGQDGTPYAGRSPGFHGRHGTGHLVDARGK